jgi:hypothetical protein
MIIKKGFKNFIKGMSKVLQFSPEPKKLEDINPNYSGNYTPEKQDAKAIADDWRNVGQNLDYAIKKFKEVYTK